MFLFSFVVLFVIWLSMLIVSCCRCFCFCRRQDLLLLFPVNCVFICCNVVLKVL